MSKLKPATIYFENAAGRLLEEPAGFMRTIWGSGPRRPEDTRAVFTHMMLALQRHGWSRILIDQRPMQPFTAEEQTWITQEWMPRAVSEGGYRHGAVIVSPNVMVRLATAYITTQVMGLPLQYRSFETEAEALAWLLQQPAAPQP
jgi:hypothetical protein